MTIVAEPEEHPPIKIRHQRDPELPRAGMISAQLESVTIGDFYTPQPKHQELHESQARYPLAEGGRGGDKTTALFLREARAGAQRKVGRS